MTPFVTRPPTTMELSMHLQDERIHHFNEEIFQLPAPLQFFVMKEDVNEVEGFPKIFSCGKVSGHFA